jgi:hypothetical protein
MTQPDGPVLLYSPPEEGAPWLIIVFSPRGRAEVFPYASEVEARGALEALRREEHAGDVKTSVAQ